MTAKDKYYKMLEQKGSLAKWMVNIGIADNLVDAETLEATLSTFTCDFSYPSKTFLMLEMFENRLIALMQDEMDECERIVRQDV